MTAQVLTAAELALLTAVQDELVPAARSMPAAGALGAARAVDGYLAARPELRRAVLGALRAVDAAAGARPFAALGRNQRLAALRRVEADAPYDFHELVRQTYNAYYTHPQVQAKLGIDRPPQPRGYELPPFDPQRTARVRGMGKLWRDA